MSYFGEVDLGPSFRPFDALHESLGFVPNLFRAQTLLPRVIEAEAGLAAAMLWKEQALPRSQKELIALVVAAAYGNTYCFTQQHQTLRSLGLRRIGHTVEVEDSPQSRGMLHAVRHLIKVSEPEGSA